MTTLSKFDALKLKFQESQLRLTHEAEAEAKRRAEHEAEERKSAESKRKTTPAASKPAVPEVPKGSESKGDTKSQTTAPGSQTVKKLGFKMPESTFMAPPAPPESPGPVKGKDYGETVPHRVSLSDIINKKYRTSTEKKSDAKAAVKVPPLPTVPPVPPQMSTEDAASALRTMKGVKLLKSMRVPKGMPMPTQKAWSEDAHYTYKMMFGKRGKDRQAWVAFFSQPAALLPENKEFFDTILKEEQTIFPSGGSMRGLINRMKDGFSAPRPATILVSNEEMFEVCKRFYADPDLVWDFRGKLWSDPSLSVPINDESAYGMPYLGPDPSDRSKDAHFEDLLKNCQKVWDGLEATLPATLEKFVGVKSGPWRPLMTTLLKNKSAVYDVVEEQKKTRPYYVMPAHLALLFSQLCHGVMAGVRSELDLLAEGSEAAGTSCAFKMSWFYGGADKLLNWVANAKYAALSYCDDNYWRLVVFINGVETVFIAAPDVKHMDMSLGPHWGAVVSRWFNMFYQDKLDTKWQILLDLGIYMSFTTPAMVDGLVVAEFGQGLSSGTPFTHVVDQVASAVAHVKVVPMLETLSGKEYKDAATAAADMRDLMAMIKAMLAKDLGLHLKDGTTDFVRVAEREKGKDWTFILSEVGQKNPWPPFLGCQLAMSHEGPVPVLEEKKLVHSLLNPVFSDSPGSKMARAYGIGLAACFYPRIFAACGSIWAASKAQGFNPNRVSVEMPGTGEDSELPLEAQPYNFKKSEQGDYLYTDDGEPIVESVRDFPPAEVFQRYYFPKEGKEEAVVTQLTAGTEPAKYESKSDRWADSGLLGEAVETKMVESAAGPVAAATVSQRVSVVSDTAKNVKESMQYQPNYERRKEKQRKHQLMLTQKLALKNQTIMSREGGGPKVRRANVLKEAYKAAGVGELVDLAAEQAEADVRDTIQQFQRVEEELDAENQDMDEEQTELWAQRMEFQMEQAEYNLGKETAVARADRAAKDKAKRPKLKWDIDPG